MTRERNALLLAQWLSPSFPVGAFAYSHGIESAIHTGAIATADDLKIWIEDVIAHGTGRNDCVLLRAAFACETESELFELDATARAMSASFERLEETRLQGAAFCQTTSAIWNTGLPDLTYPVAVGAVAKKMTVDVSLTAALYLQAFTSNLVSVAVRAVPLGQTEGQAVLAAVSCECESVARDTGNATLDDLQSTAFMSDIAALTHETLHHRIFRS